MKIFFCASVRGDLALMRTIYHQIVSIGHQHTFRIWETSGPETFYQVSKQEQKARVKIAFPAIMKAQLMVAEVSLPSVTVGQFIQYATNNKIPVLALHEKGTNPAFLQAGENDKLLVLEYEKNSLKETLEQGIDYLGQTLDTRFTLILPPHIMKHLNKINKKGQTRSEYIRDLIEKDMASTK